MQSPAIYALFTLLLAGAAAGGGLLVVRMLRTRYKLRYTLAYLEHFRRLVTGIKGGELDEQALAWLKSHAEGMQRLLGTRGRIEYWSPAGRYLERDFAVVVRTIQEIEEGGFTDHLAASCQITLIRYLTDLQQRYR